MPREVQPSPSKREYGVGKPHIFKTRWGWCSVVTRAGIYSNCIGWDFKTICRLNGGAS